MFNLVAFDIETIPDADLLRRSLGNVDAGDEEIIKLAQEEQLAKTGGKSDFLPIVFHKVAVISAVIRKDNTFKISSKAIPELTEKEVVESFFNLIDKLQPTLISWNGTGFDLPVLILRALRHKVVAEGFWTGPGDKWNQYKARYHEAHHDIMDIIGMYQNKSKLENVALACDLPGKMGYSGAKVYEMFQNEKYTQISNYCETDALNTYLVWLNLQLQNGKLSPEKFQEECNFVEQHLASSKEDHIIKFLTQWAEYRSASNSSKV